jgi:CubicO group peptidase (beta-lactamase class C family)
MIVVHEGRIIFETYPGMRPYDNRAWMSCAKSIVGFIIWDLIRDGKVEAEAPVETYLTDWATTEWRGTRVIDIADMCSGMDVIETPENRLNPHHVANRYNQAAVGAPNADGVVEVQQEVMRMAKRLRSPGEAFEYASVNTSTLGMIAQAVENKVWADIVFDRIWKDMTAEGDLEYSLTPQGFAQMQGMVGPRGAGSCPKPTCARCRPAAGRRYISAARSETGCRVSLPVTGQWPITSSGMPSSPMAISTKAGSLARVSTSRRTETW